MSGAPAELLLRRYQVIELGSTTPMVVTPSPFQSPTTGIQLGSPYTKGAKSGAPAELVLRRYQVPVPGSKTPGVARVDGRMGVVGGGVVVPEGGGVVVPEGGGVSPPEEGGGCWALRGRT